MHLMTQRGVGRKKDLAEKKDVSMFELQKGSDGR